jgi:hypothetical protein
MATDAFTRSYYHAMSKILSPLEFRRKGGVYWRERNEVLHIISLHRVEKFTADIAIQPLVFPFDTFILNLGARLDRFGPNLPPRWNIPNVKSELEQVVEQFSQKVLAHAVPWLDRFQSVRDIVEIDSMDAWQIGPIEWTTRREIVGLCALDARLFDKGEQLLREVYNKSYSEPDANAPQWISERRTMLHNFLELLQSKDYDAIQQRLGEYKIFTRTALGI